MKVQSFKNHTRMVPLFHYVAFSLVLFALIMAVVYLFKAITAGSGRLQALGLVALVLSVILALWHARVFALRAQDRAIRAEENFRHFILTGKPLPANLRMGQIVALRFAGDEEFVALVNNAVNEKLSSKQIKAAVQNWRGDYYRV